MPKIEIPKFLDHLPTFAGFPVPFTTTWIGLKPDFRIPDAYKIALCLSDKLCAICGRRLGDYSYLIGGPATAASKMFTDPPMHEKCAQFSMSICPFLNGTREEYSERPVAAGHEHAVVKDERVVPERPPVMYIFKVPTKTVRLETEDGDPYITATFVGKREYRGTR